MIRGVFFGEYHTAEDWDLILNSKKIDPPAPKVVKVTVDGRNGDLDLSEALTGEIVYNNRNASFTFLLTEGTQLEREEKLATIINLIHGNQVNIIHPDDPEHYLIGRCSVSDVNNDKAYASFMVSADCDPYRYSVNETRRMVELSDTFKEVALLNTGRKTIIPTLIVSNTVNITFGSTSVSLSAGTYQLPALTLKTGSNVITVKGSGTLTLEYREAVL